MNDVLLAIIDYLIAGGFAVAKDTDIFRDFTPELPDACVIVNEYAGSSPAPFTDMSVRSIQIEVRNKSQINGKTLCWSIYKSLYSDDNMITLNSRRCIIEMRNTPIKIFVDEHGRSVIAFNLALTTNFN